MTWHFTSWILLAAALLQAALASRVWRRWRAPFTLPLTGLLAATALYTGGFAFEVAAGSVAQLHWIVAVEYLGIAFLPACLLLTATSLTGWSLWHRRSVVTALLALSTLCAAAKLADPWLELIYRRLGFLHEHGLTVITFEPGPGYWVMMGYLNFAQLTALLAIARVWSEAGHLLRRQLQVALVTFSLPWVAHLLYLTDTSPFDRLDLVPFLFPPAVIVFAWAVLHEQFADIGPIARDVLVETIRTGVLVCDARLRVVDANPAARQQLQLGRSGRLTRPLAEITAAHPALAALCRQTAEAHTELQLHPEPGECWQASWQPLHTRTGKLRGFLLTLVDITERKRHERQLQTLVAERTQEWRKATAAALRASEEEQDRIGRELHDTLCPELIGIGRHAATLAERPDLPPDARDSLRQLAAQAGTATRCARDLSHLLARSDFAHAPFDDLLRALLLHLEQTLGLTCELTFDTTFPAPSHENALHLLRIIREAVTNAARHAAARQIWIDFINQPDAATLCIANDGRPLPPPADCQEGLGLRQIRMRATLLGAEFSLLPGESGGAVLKLRFPASCPPPPAPHAHAS